MIKDKTKNLSKCKKKKNNNILILMLLFDFIFTLIEKNIR